MKRTKKTFAVILALILCLSLSVSALAAERTYSITIKNESTGHTYEAYQIFAGSLGADGELANITWGSGVNGAALLAALKTADNAKYGQCSTAADVAAAIGTTAADAAAFAAVAGGHLSTVKVTGTAGQGSYTIAGLAAGYYLVKDADNSQTGSDTYTDYIVQVVEDVTVNHKGGTVITTQKVQDTNDSVAASTSGWQDSADYDIGDSVPFQISVSLPDNYGSFETYALTIHDVQSAGLTFLPDTVSVSAGGTQLARDTHYEVVTEGLGDACTFHIVIDDLKTAAPDAVSTDSVVVTYNATLNEDAVIGSAGNPNESYATFSNNPHGTGTGETPKDKVTVFTYKVVVEKTDENAAPLAGAEFQLQKYNAGTAAWDVLDAAVISADEGVNSVFTFSGLDDGLYRLKETVTPAGYNTIEDIKFTITADHDTESVEPKLTTLSVTGAKYIDEEGQELVDLGAVTFTPDLTAGSLTTVVENVGGTQLPETGGIGTTIFHVLGGLLVAGAVIILVMRFRRTREE